MSIGIYDSDICTYTLVPFNLAVMKLSAYYKRHREIVTFAKEFHPERNSKFFYVKDWDDGNYPLLLNAPNVTYLGHAFSGPPYIPMDEDIELMKPDSSIYEAYEKDIMAGQQKTLRHRIFRSMINAEHLRLSIDGTTLWSKYMRQLRQPQIAKLIMLHDYDLGIIPDAWDAVQEILKLCRQGEARPTIGMKFPMNIKNGKDLLKWSGLRTDAVFFSLRYNGLIDDDIFFDWVTQSLDQKNTALIEYNVTGDSQDENDFIKNKLMKIYEQVIISRSFKLKLTLKYNEDFFVDKRWERVIDFINCYQHSYQGVDASLFINKIIYDTAADFVKGSKTCRYYSKNFPFTVQQMRDLFWFVADESPELFDAFYHMNFNAIKGGWYDLARN